MKSLKSICIAAGATSLYLLALSSLANKSNDYYGIQYIKDCEVIKQVEMTTEQRLTYIALNEEAEIMEEFAKPLESAEKEIEALAESIKSDTDEFVKNSGHSVAVNLDNLSSSMAKAMEISAMISEKRVDIEALTSQANIISEKALAFEEETKKTAPNVDYDNVRAIGPNTNTNFDECESELVEI